MTTTNLKYLPAASFKFVGSGNEVEGYASIFGERDLGGDIVTAGAFTKSIAKIKQAGRRLPMLWSHRQEDVVGSWTDVQQDSVGLHVRGLINQEVDRGREALALVKGGDLSGLSIGYLVPFGARTVTAGNAYLTQVKLLEISLVAVPMGENARIILKDMGGVGAFSEFLQSVGVSRREAEWVARKSWPAISKTDPVEDDDPGIKNLLAEVKAARIDINKWSQK